MRKFTAVLGTVLHLCFLQKAFMGDVFALIVVRSQKKTIVVQFEAW